MNNFLNKNADKEKYVVFYTRHTSFNCEPENKIVGYFKVGKTFLFKWSAAGELHRTMPSTEECRDTIKRCKEKDKLFKRGFKAKEYVLLPKEKCKRINYNSRGVPVSWGKSSVKTYIDDILKKLTKQKQEYKKITNEYKVKTATVMELLRTIKGREEIISICQSCNAKSQCYWGKNSEQVQRKILKELYASNPEC